MAKTKRQEKLDKVFRALEGKHDVVCKIPTCQGVWGKGEQEICDSCFCVSGTNHNFCLDCKRADCGSDSSKDPCRVTGEYLPEGSR